MKIFLYRLTIITRIKSFFKCLAFCLARKSFSKRSQAFTELLYYSFACTMQMHFRLRKLTWKLLWVLFEQILLEIGFIEEMRTT